MSDMVHIGVKMPKKLRDEMMRQKGQDVPVSAYIRGLVRKALEKNVGKRSVKRRAA